MEVVTELFEALLSLISPVSCAGCGQWDISLCKKYARSCHHPWAAAAAMPGWKGRESVWALDTYQGAARNLILTVKHNPRQDLSVWQKAVAENTAKIFPQLFGSLSQVTLVPAPSSWKRTLHGREIVGKWCQMLAGELRRRNIFAQVEPCLGLRWGARGQAGSDLGERLRGRRGQMYVRYLPPGPIVLVDDVAATGATLAEARKTLKDEGLPVIGALVWAASKPRR